MTLMFIFLLIFAGFSTTYVFAGNFLELVQEASTEEVQNAIDAGADVNARGENGETALMKASLFNNNSEVIETLLDNGAIVNAIAKDGMTALMGAALFNENPEIVEILLDRGANISARDIKEKTALIEAVRNNKLEVIEILLDRGADINAKDMDESSVLMWAAAYNNSDVVELLLDKGAEINARNREGTTALIGAVSNNNFEVVELLLDRGADINIRDRYGATALTKAASRNNIKIVEILIDKGAEVNLRDENVFTNMFINYLESNKPSMSFDIKKEIIKIIADIHGWQETRNIIRERHIAYFEEDYNKIIQGTLWTPTLKWVDIMHEVDLYFEDEQVAKDRYEDYKQNLKNNNKLIFTLEVIAVNEEKVHLENLTFILEVNDEHRYRDINSADVSSRRVERKSAFGVTAYKNTFDLVFDHEDLNINDLEKIKLYTIFDKSRERVEMGWNLYSMENDIQDYSLAPGELIQQSPLPVYPRDLVGESATGRVLVEAYVSEDGEVQSVSVIESSGIDSMDRNAQSTVERGWSFRSYNRSYIMEIEVIFDVDERDNPVIDVDLLDLRFE